MLDLKRGHHQMPLHEDSRACTAMGTPLGPMQWKVVPMGAKNGNAVFQRKMEDLLGPVRDCADRFLDDIIIGFRTQGMSEDERVTPEWNARGPIRKKRQGQAAKAHEIQSTERHQDEGGGRRKPRQDEREVKGTNDRP